MKVIATKGGRFSPRDGSEPFTLKPGDEVPASLVDAALSQGWGKEAAASKKAPKPADDAVQED